MNVKLLHAAPLELVVLAIRQCYESFDRSDSYNEMLHYYTSMENIVKSYKSSVSPKFILGPKDKALILNIIESGHTSTLEHINITFKLEKFTRDVLQELSRHRHSSPSVKSSRYTLKELKDETSFFNKNGIDIVKASKYVDLTNDDLLNVAIVTSIDAIRIALRGGATNDEVKPVLPESYLVDAIFTINIRSLRNLLQLRTSKRAYHKIRNLVFAMYDAVPEEYKFMLEDCIQE